MTYEEQMAGYRARCEAALDDVIKGFFKEGSVVSDAAAYTLTNGGKRVRGVLALAVCDLLEGEMRLAEVFAAAIEMVHAFSLIHDDLPCMDDDDMRRGKPAAHIVYGEAAALLAGDLLALEAFDVIAAAPFEPRLLMAGARELAVAAGARGMIYGQELDLKYEKEPADEAALQEIHRHKTGALIRAAAHLGVAAAGRTPAENEAITRFADNVGLVFQIVDDILDVTSTQEVLGKPVGSDQQQHKTTFVTAFGLEPARREAARLTAEAVDGLSGAFGARAAFLCRFAQALAERVQ